MSIFLQGFLQDLSSGFLAADLANASDYYSHLSCRCLITVQLASVSCCHLLSPVIFPASKSVSILRLDWHSTYLPIQHSWLTAQDPSSEGIGSPGVPSTPPSIGLSLTVLALVCTMDYSSATFAHSEALNLEAYQPAHIAINVSIFPS